MLKRSLTRLRLLRGAGILLVTLGIIHLLATPHIATLVRDSASPASARWLTPPMLLNHILVGVLLIPLGYLTTYAAPYAVNGASWAQVVVRTTALSVASSLFVGVEVLFCSLLFFFVGASSFFFFCLFFFFFFSFPPISRAHQA